jgi:hypothetical protein
VSNGAVTGTASGRGFAITVSRWLWRANLPPQHHAEVGRNTRLDLGECGVTEDHSCAFITPMLHSQQLALDQLR